MDDRLVTMQVSYRFPSNHLLILRHRVAMGHGGPGTFPVAGRGFLPWRRLLRIGVRRQQRQVLRDTRQLARRVPHSG